MDENKKKYYIRLIKEGARRNGISNLQEHLKEEFIYLKRMEYENPEEFKKTVEDLGGLEYFKNMCIFLKEEIIDKEQGEI